MPLSTNEATNKTSQDLVDQMHAIFGNHPGYRPVHAKGHLLRGTFTPTPAAASLSSAPHFNTPSTPLTARFSSSTGLPKIADTDGGANPRGLGLRFHLGGRRHTDIVAHSTPLFPVRTGEEFLALLQAQVASSSSSDDAAAAAAAGTGQPSPIEQFLATHPETVKFVQAPKPSPVSFATAAYYGINAFKFVDSEGAQAYFRYRVVPVAGEASFSEEELQAGSKGADYLFEELATRVAGGEGPLKFKLVAQMADEGDTVTDATEYWPEDRKLVELGAITLDQFVDAEESMAEQKQVIFDPIPRVEGIEPSEDPMLDFRAALYLVSGRERRKAEYTE